MKTVNTEVQLTYPPGLSDGWVGDDVFGLYLHNTRQKKRLDREEVNHLAKTVQLGIAAQESLDNEDTLFSVEESDMLLSTVKEGIQARNTIVETNTGLVHKWANRQQNRGVDLTDLIQAGNLGLIRAAEKFNPDLGFAFSTYATRWIRSFIENCVHTQGRMIALPVEESQKLQKLERIKLEHNLVTGIEICAEELAKKAGYDLGKVKNLLALAEVSVMSLDYEIEDSEKGIIEYIAPERDVVSEEDQVIDRIMEQSAQLSVRSLMSNSTLSNQELEVVRMRFGIGYERSMKNVEIAKTIGRSRKIVADMFKKAMQQLEIEARAANLDSIIE